MKPNLEKIICDECKGDGEIYVEPFDDPEAWWFKPCPKCKGNKKLDWIEQIVGVSEANIIY